MRLMLLILLAAATALPQATIPPNTGSGSAPYVLRGTGTPAANDCAKWEVVNGVRRLTSAGGPCGTTNTVAWENITDKPSEFTPATHVHLPADITGLQATVRGYFSVSSPLVYDSATGVISCPTCGAGGGGTWGSITGTLSDQTDLNGALGGKAALSHVHIIGDVTGLQTALDGKAALIHSHSISQIADLQTTLDGKAATSHTHTLSAITDAAAALAAKEDAITTLSAAKGGLGADASAFSGVVKMSGGVASVVTGTATDCILVNGTSGPCGTGGGGSSGLGVVAATYESATTWTYLGTSHAFGTCDLAIAAYVDDSGSWKQILPASIACNATSFDVTVTWATAQAGRLVLNAGGGTGTANQAFSFTSQTTVDVSHGYGVKNIIWAVYNTSDELVEPNSITHLSTTATRFTFATAQSGYIVANRAGVDVEGGGGSGDTTLVQNTGAGAAVLKTGTNVVGRTLVAGANVTITENTDTITIASTAEGGGGGLATVATDDTLVGDGSVGDPLGVNPATVPMFVTAAATINDWGTIGAASCVEKTFTFSGALTGDAVVPQWPAALPAGLTGLMRVSLADTLAVRLCNATGSGVAVANGFQFGAMILRSF